MPPIISIIPLAMKSIEMLSGGPVIPLSGVSGVGVDWALDRLLEAIPANDRPVEDDGEEDEVQWSPV